ncbi:hypothetical protein BaRGS_00002038 [Batillaria attramentaria]|uniref:Cytochrome b-c1 complex subunit 2, mitochondrial n=1 Tax=Batillaria attramentaria TaxID=370345 RepID=A0ABD0M558_9CAEN
MLASSTISINGLDFYHEWQESNLANLKVFSCRPPARLYSAAARQDARESGTALPRESPKLSKLPNGVTVASIENYSPVSRIAFVANAGSRYETGDNLGVTHCLRIASGLSTQGATAFGITRNLEQIGANFTCSSSREYMFYTVNCLRDNLEVASNVLQQVTTAPTFKPWELADIQERLKLDLAVLKSQPNAWTYDLLHQAAFRDTLGRSLYAPEYMIGKYNSEQLLHYMKTYYSTGRVALVGVGVDHDELVAQAQRFHPFSSAAIAADKAKYSGGELRVDTGGDLTYAAFAVEGPSPRNAICRVGLGVVASLDCRAAGTSWIRILSLAGKDLLHAAVLQNVMGMGPSIKYSLGSATSRLTQAAAQATPAPFAISCINANYTDGGLFGFFAVTQPSEMEKVLRAAFNQFAEVTKTGLEEKHVAVAKQQLKSQIGMYLETNESQLQDLGEQALGSDQVLTATELFKYVDQINTSDVTAVAKKLVNGKPSMAAVGNLTRTPYLDDLLK